MTYDIVSLRGLQEKSAQEDKSREMIDLAAEKSMHIEVDALTKATFGKRAARRKADHVNGLVDVSIAIPISVVRH